MATETINVLSTNYHVPYLSMLAQVPNTVWWVLSFGKNMANRTWQDQYRPLPPNVRHIVLDHPDWMSRINFDGIHVAVLQSLNDMAVFKDFPQPKLMVFHNSIHTELRNMNDQQKNEKKEQLYGLCASMRMHPIYISDWKAEGWGVPGSVIEPGINPSEFTHGYSGRNTALLRCCSNFQFRDFMNGKTLSDAVCMGIPNLLLGEGNGEECLNNPGPDGKSLTNVGITQSFEHGKRALWDHRAFVLTNIPSYEDGWNLAVLEAMMSGMPVLSTYHPRTMIQDGVNGYMSDDPNELRGRAMQLLRDRELSQAMGARARETVMTRFPWHRFLGKWSALLTASLPKVTMLDPQKIQSTPV